MNVTLLRCFLLLVISLAAFGQGVTPNSPPSSRADASASVAAYTAEPSVLEHHDSVYTMAADGTGTRQVTMVAKLQSDSAVKQSGILLIPYASSSEHVEIVYARVRRPDGT